MQRDSTDITADDRMQMARVVWENRGAYDGFVIAHGTDTLACTAALLHHLLPHIDRPVIVTPARCCRWARRARTRPGNLLDALRVAADGRRGVYAVLRGSILRGTNVLKVHSTALDAFVSANEPPAGRVADGNVIWDAPAPGRRNAAPRAAPRAACVRAAAHARPSAVVLLGPARLSERHHRDVRRRRHPGAHGTGRACTDSGRHARFPDDTVRRGRASICINMRSAAGRRPWARCRSACGRSRTRSPRSCAENCKKQGGGR